MIHAYKMQSCTGLQMAEDVWRLQYVLRQESSTKCNEHGWAERKLDRIETGCNVQDPSGWNPCKVETN